MLKKMRSKIYAQSLLVRAATKVLILLLCLIQPVAAQVNSSSNASQSPALNPKLPTIFVVGDSTANNNANGARGWGDPFASYFDTAKVNVTNRARDRKSTRLNSSHANI